MAAMPDLVGFEPAVGEIRALRTFRVGVHGRLFPLFQDRAWSDVMNTAQCVLSPTDSALHVPPEPDCTCGFYGYSSEAAALDYPHSRHVLAVVVCWGRMIIGTRGIRAQYARLEAIWMSDTVPADLVSEVAARYRSAVVYPNKETMLNRHPVGTGAADAVEPAVARNGWPVGFRLAITAALVCSLPPTEWSHSTAVRTIAQLLPFGFLLLAVTMTAWRRGGMGVGRLWLVIIAGVLWCVAPVAGWAGWLLIRLPLIEVAGLVALERHFQAKDSRRFPARIGPADRARRPGPTPRAARSRRDPPS